MIEALARPSSVTSFMHNDGPTSRRPFVSWELGTDLILTIAGLITKEHSPFYDDADLARDAAACACVGNSAFTELGEAIYNFLSPRFGEDPGVNEGSNISELKAVLKSWGRKTAGRKAELWQRIREEVEGDRSAEHDDGGEEPQRVLCPVAAGPKRRIQEQQVARVSKTKAKEVYGVYPYKLSQLPAQLSSVSAFGATQTYAVKDVKAIARTSYKSYDELRRSQQRSKDWMSNYRSKRDDRTSRVMAVLRARGVEEYAAKRATDHLWHLPYFSDGPCTSDSPPEEWLRRGAEAAADEAQTWLFHVTRTSYPAHFMRLRANHVYAKSSKYKQEIVLEKRAFVLALQDWAAGRTLHDIQTHPDLPRHMRPEAEHAWHAAQQCTQQEAQQRARLQQAQQRAQQEEQQRARLQQAQQRAQQEEQQRGRLQEEQQRARLQEEQQRAQQEEQLRARLQEEQQRATQEAARQHALQQAVQLQQIQLQQAVQLQRIQLMQAVHVQLLPYWPQAL